MIYNLQYKFSAGLIWLMPGSSDLPVLNSESRPWFSAPHSSVQGDTCTFSAHDIASRMHCVRPLDSEGHPYPAYLSVGWFQPDNAGALRGHLRHMLLQMFVAQAKDGSLPGVARAAEEVAAYEGDAAVVRCGVCLSVCLSVAGSIEPAWVPDRDEASGEPLWLAVRLKAWPCLMRCLMGSVCSCSFLTALPGSPAGPGLLRCCRPTRPATGSVHLQVPVAGRMEAHWRKERA
jgi:hypothetical protein